jgi:hypothetical protein
MSTTIDPIGSVTGMSAPIAAAIGSSISHTWRRTGVGRGVTDRAALDRGRTRRHADHDFGEAREAALAVHLLDEVLDHLLGDIDVGDDAVAQRADRLDLVGRLAHHQLGVVADRLDALDAVDRLDGDHRRLVQHNAAAADVYHRVGGAEIDRHVLARNLRKLNTPIGAGHSLQCRLHRTGFRPFAPQTSHRRSRRYRSM